MFKWWRSSRTADLVLLIELGGSDKLAGRACNEVLIHGVFGLDMGPNDKEGDTAGSRDGVGGFEVALRVSPATCISFPTKPS